MRDRFGIPIRLQFYTIGELEFIVKRGARVMGLAMSDEGANEIARRSRGTPRIAGRLLRRVADVALVDKAPSVTRAIADKALRMMDVDQAGLDQMDMKYLRTIAEKFGGGPVGVETMAASLSEARDAIEEIIEPYLIQQGFVQRTPRGRLLTSLAFRHLGLPEPQREAGSSGCSRARRSRPPRSVAREVPFRRSPAGLASKPPCPGRLPPTILRECNAEGPGARAPDDAPI